MIKFEVKDMTCGHCVSTITKAVMAADRDATVQIDLASHLVTVEPSVADAATLGAAIEQAGYTPVAVDAVRSQPAAATTRRGGCCCG